LTMDASRRRIANSERALLLALSLIDTQMQEMDEEAITEMLAASPASSRVPGPASEAVCKTVGQIPDGPGPGDGDGGGGGDATAPCAVSQ
jgi:hypothetical protein